MENWLENIFLQILNMSVTAGYCITAVLLLRLLFQKAPRKYLYALWLVAAFRLICPVSVSTGVSLFNTGLFSISAPEEAVGTMEYITVDETGAGLQAVNTGNETMNVFVNQQVPHAVHTATGYSMKTLMDVVYPYLAHIWAAGIAVFVVYYVVSVWRLRKKVRWGVRVPKENEEAILWSGWPDAEVYECDELASPFAIGILKPRIYIPCRLEGEQRQMVLLHEQYHIHRWDHLVKAFSFFLLAVYWFHPLVWAAWFAMCKDMEMSCDEKVLELLGEGHGKEYSMTLLAFAAEGCSRTRMPLGFGEHDVKSRIRHALNFKKPALWVSVLAATAIIVVVAVFGTNGKGEGQAEISEAQTQASQLYEVRNPYVGDISADGKVIGAIRSVLPEFKEIQSYKTELQTSEEPYQFHFILETADVESPKLTKVQEATLAERMAPAATLMLALIDNLGAVKWSWRMAEGYDEYSVFVKWNVEQAEDSISVKWDVEQAEEWYGIEHLKEYGTSPEKVDELLDILEQKAAPDNEELLGDLLSGVDTDEFWDWYAHLPYELYEKALPHGSEYWSCQEEETRMTILAQTRDKVVTVYGCSSEEYGNRGITIDYRITPDGDGNHTYLDLGWNATQPGYEVAMADYDRDGYAEIALTYLEVMGEELYRQGLVVFETFETGHLEPYYFDYDARQAELEKILGIAYDRENKQVHILDNGKPESSVPLLSISHLEETEYEYEGEAADVELQNILLFTVGEDIRMSIEPGVILGNRGTPLLARNGIPQDEAWKLQLNVEYHFSREGGYFTLSDPEPVWIYR